MINQTEQMTYRLSNLDIQQQRVSYQMSTKEVLSKMKPLIQVWLL